MQQTLFYLSLTVTLFTLIPLIRHDFWIFRVFEYPRLQKLTLSAILLAVNLFFLPTDLPQKVALAILIANLTYLVYLVSPFTILGKKQIISTPKRLDKSRLTLLIANVYQDNRRSEDYLKLIRKCDPDVLLLVETNHWWQQQIDVITEAYPFQLKIPLENTYGMLLYSRLDIKDGKINFLVEQDIPSMELEVKLPAGQWVKLYCLHPKPPVPQENPKSTERDKEILMVAERAKQCELPVVVMGDLNDVAWSYTTELFGKISGLLDPRRGRGFFNSFNAKYFFLRFPLDHIFCSADFSLSGIRRMNSCGSDHFPMCVSLQYDPRAEVSNDQPSADQSDQEIASEKINA